VSLLNRELEKMNDFFVEKEEEFVIRIHVLRQEMDRLVCASHPLLLHTHTHICICIRTDVRSRRSL